MRMFNNVGILSLNPSRQLPKFSYKHVLDVWSGHMDTYTWTHVQKKNAIEITEAFFLETKKNCFCE